MNNCKMIHETVLRDIVDVINDVKDFDQIAWIQNKNSVGSIAKRASNLILTFPVIISSSINIKTASMISKAIERKCVSLLQILFASISMTNYSDLNEYLGQFHQNLNNVLTIDDFITVMDKLSESGELTINDPIVYKAVMEDMKNINNYLETNFNENSINNYRIYSDIYGNSKIVKEETDPGVTNVLNALDNVADKYDKKYNDDTYKKAVKKIKKDIATKNRNTRSNKDDNNNDYDYFKNQLLPQEVKKSNELVPTLITVKFTTVKDGVKHTQTGIVGVKAKLYPINSMDIINRLAAKYSDSNNLFKFIKATTREISFFRDFAFAIDKAKFDAINISRQSSNSKMFKLLERRAIKNKFAALLKKNNASPITSLVISSDEVEYLKKYHNLDMEKANVTKTILEAYNLMDIVLVDESLEVAKFLYDDGDGLYESFAFDSLEKESNDSSYKKIINLMSKIS